MLHELVCRNICERIYILKYRQEGVVGFTMNQPLDFVVVKRNVFNILPISAGY